MINAQLDIYDDPSGSVLKGKIAALAEIPDFVKTAERLTPQELEKLPDDVFALVALDGGRKMRKFACVDKGNTALSVVYFLENKDKLPIEAQKTAAANLLKACGWYGMEPPAELERTAGIMQPKLPRARDVVQGRGPEARKKRTALREELRSTCPAGPPEKTALVGALMGATTAATGLAQGHKDYKRRQAAMNAGMPAGEAFKLKEGELSGSSPMPYSMEIPEKQAALQPYVDITGKLPPPRVVHEMGTRHALVKEGSARYPIDTASQVQQAFTYFEKYASSFTPHERHIYCLNVSRRADELGMKVPEAIAKYGSATMSKDAGVQIYKRQRLFREGSSEQGLLQEMREKCASVKPEVLAVALEHFDRQHGLDQMWDNGLPDPYFSIFGVEKRAEWSFVNGNDRIDETRLKRLSKDMTFRKDLCAHFGSDMVEEFHKNPQQIFDSLPLDSKRIIMRLSQQVEE